MNEQMFFMIFGGLAVLGALFMIWTKNVIHGAYGLAVVLLSVAGLFVLLNAVYLAVVQMFMYAGGVVVLLVFGIMLTNRSKEGAPVTGHHNLLPAIVLIGALLVFVVRVILSSSLSWNESDVPNDQVKEIGQLFITDYLLAFEIIAILLLAVLVGAAYLGKKSSEND